MFSLKMPMSAAEERRLRRQHRILANSEQRMKLVMGETIKSDERSVPEEETAAAPQDKDRELREIARELEELRKKELCGTFRGEGGSAAFGGGDLHMKQEI